MWADALRSGVETAYVQALRICRLRRSRSCGVAKSQLQHLRTATALNGLRSGAWLTGAPIATTRESAVARFMISLPNDVSYDFAPRVSVMSHQMLQAIQ